MTPKDWTLLVIAAAKPKPIQPVYLQKTLYLLEQRLSLKKLQVKRFYQFEPYDYGPFCPDIYSDAEDLMAQGLVHVDRPASQSYRFYSMTDLGTAHTLSRKPFGTGQDAPAILIPPTRLLAGNDDTVS
jgi:hypothetical protein